MNTMKMMILMKMMVMLSLKMTMIMMMMCKKLNLLCTVPVTDISFYSPAIPHDPK